MTRPSMVCPKCGTEMNHQADKLVHPVTPEETAAMTAAFDGVLETVFACPACGWIDSLRGAPPAASDH
jgi:predicted RNA-binding Zn-ribbon protein involved in translation (DUF1610 family)